MPTGTKIAAIVLVVLLGAAGLYYAVVAPPASNNKSAAAKESGAASGGTAVNGLSSQTPGTLAPAVPSVGAQPSAASSTPAVGTLGTSGTVGSPTPVPTPVPTGLPAGSGTTGVREQPGFAPGSLGAGGTGKGDLPASARPAPAPGTTVNGIPVNGGTASAGTASGSQIPAVGAVPANSTAPAVNTVGGPRPTTAAPVGTVPSSSATGGSASPTTASGETTHTVASGETMGKIAKKYFGNENAWRAIAKANPTVDPTSMKIGTKLRIPASDATTATASKPAAGSTPGNTPSTATTTATAAGSDGSHVVASGDTLASISRKYYGNTKYWERIYSENKGLIGSDPAALKIGQKLKIPAKSTVVGGAAASR